MRPIYIGVIGKHIANSQINHTTSSMIRDEIIQALTYFGATPIGIPLPAHYPDLDNDVYLQLKASFPKKEMALIDNYLSLCNGFIFQGGNHLDHYEYELARIIYRRGIPALGFCGGQTVMVSALIPDAKIINVNTQIHNQPQVDCAHEITVLPDTKFGDIIKTQQLQVNSRHRTCITDLPKSNQLLRISALGPEGYAEVIESSSENFYLSTRFHPESNFRDQYMSRIFETFIIACSSTA